MQIFPPSTNQSAFIAPPQFLERSNDSPGRSGVNFKGRDERPFVTTGSVLHFVHSRFHQHLASARWSRATPILKTASSVYERCARIERLVFEDSLIPTDRNVLGQKTLHVSGVQDFADSADLMSKGAGTRNREKRHDRPYHRLRLHYLRFGTGLRLHRALLRLCPAIPRRHMG
jgi:hypothetical protein